MALKVLIALSLVVGQHQVPTGGLNQIGGLNRAISPYMLDADWRRHLFILFEPFEPDVLFAFSRLWTLISHLFLRGMLDTDWHGMLLLFR
eukprot:s7054_g3.t1